MEEYNLAPLRVASVTTIVWLGLSAFYCIKLRKKKFQFNARSWKSWIYISITLLIFTVVLTTCQCTDQVSISKGPLVRLDLQTMKPYPTATIECRSPLSDLEIKKLIDRSVTLQGQLSLAAKESPFVTCGGEGFYFDGSFINSPKYQEMEGKTVSVTGILRFKHYESREKKTPAGYTLRYKAPLNHFYFDATAKIELRK